MSGTHTGTKRAAEPDPPSPSSPSPSESHITHGGGGGGGGSGGGGGGLHGITAAQKAFHFLDGPADVLNASTACRRWRKLACAGSVWRAKAEREGILDKAEAFEVEVPAAAEGGSLEDEGAASMAFYARVFMLKGYKMRDEDEDEAHDNPDHDGGIQTAVRVWFADPSAAKAKYGPIASWDVSEVTEMRGLFNGATSFNGDLSRWNVSSVEDMNSMFSGATSFNGDLSRWNVSSVVHVSYMFHRATLFNGDLSRWNVSNVAHMSSMFGGATLFNGDLSRWNVSNVEAMSRMFHGATSFNRQLDGAWSTSTADKTYMFLNSPGTIAGRTKRAHGTICTYACC